MTSLLSLSKICRRMTIPFWQLMKWHRHNMKLQDSQTQIFTGNLKENMPFHHRQNKNETGKSIFKLIMNVFLIKQSGDFYSSHKTG